MTRIGGATGQYEIHLGRNPASLDEMLNAVFT